MDFSGSCYSKLHLDPLQSWIILDLGHIPVCVCLIERDGVVASRRIHGFEVRGRGNGGVGVRNGEDVLVESGLFGGR
ncbi:hypothetical protein HanRHA438_Chr10g0474681 [Helianthus annuus]|nr:hypothetical protein HanRHA438_Chr10g0474681 [Helianthus annuus]